MPEARPGAPKNASAPPALVTPSQPGGNLPSSRRLPASRNGAPPIPVRYRYPASACGWVTAARTKVVSDWCWPTPVYSWTSLAGAPSQKRTLGWWDLNVRFGAILESFHRLVGSGAVWENWLVTRWANLRYRHLLFQQKSPGFFDNRRTVTQIISHGSTRIEHGFPLFL